MLLSTYVDHVGCTFTTHVYKVLHCITMYANTEHSIVHLSTLQYLGTVKMST